MRLLFFILLLVWNITLSANPSAAPLIVGMELSYPPFEMMSPQGEPAGISVDIAKALGEFLHRKAVIKNIPFVGLIPSLNDGKIDLIISSMTITERRKQAIDFSEPYLTTGLSLLASAKSDIKGVEDLDKKGRRVVVKSGTSGEVYAKQHLKNSRVLILDKESSCVLEVVQGKADAFIYDQLSVFNNWQKHPDTTRPILTPFQIEKWGIGVKKGNTELLNEINAFIDDFRAKGGFDKLGERYLKPQLDAFKNMGIPFVF